jgi:hypothetical protein
VNQLAGGHAAGAGDEALHAFAVDGDVVTDPCIEAGDTEPSGVGRGRLGDGAGAGDRDQVAGHDGAGSGARDRLSRHVKREVVSHRMAFL